MSLPLAALSVLLLAASGPVGSALGPESVGKDPGNLTAATPVPLGSPFTGPAARGLSAVNRPVDQSRLTSEAEAFAHAWARGDTEALGGFMGREGIRLHLPGEDHQLIRPHQARAALDVFLRQYSPGRTEVSRVSPTAEGSQEGFAEVRWITGSPGLAEPVIFTVFIGYGLKGDGWVVTEIRVLF